MRIVIPPAKPLPRFEFTKEELEKLVGELHEMHLGRIYRTAHPQRSQMFPKLDEFAFLAESLVEG
jgi:hypothetical protein